MVFSSTIFLCVYLPLVLLGYYICPKKGKNLFLLIVSLIFYAWGEPKYVFLMIFSILVNYVFGLLMDKHRENKKRLKLMLVISVIIDLGLLSVFKYTDFIITNINSVFGAGFDLLNIALPIGISFYTFQAVSYLIDVYWDDCEASHSLVNFACCISLFPQLIAGPIVRYKDVNDQLISRHETPTMFNSGVRPAVNVGLSVSRVGGAAQTKAMKKANANLRIELAQYKEMESFAQFSSDLDAETRRQLEHGKALMEMLKQPLYQPKSDAEQVVTLVLASHGVLDELPTAELRTKTSAFVRQFRADVSGTMDKITATGKLEPEMVDAILNAWKAYAGGDSHAVQ